MIEHVDCDASFGGDGHPDLVRYEMSIVSIGWDEAWSYWHLLATMPTDLLERMSSGKVYMATIHSKTRQRCCEGEGSHQLVVTSSQVDKVCFKG